MRLLDRLTYRDQRRSTGNQPDRFHRTISVVPMLPAQIRHRRFSLTRLFRRGLDPDEVRGFLVLVADELAAAQRAAERHRAEADRVKNALRRWQSQQAQARNRACNEYAAGYR